MAKPRRSSRGAAVPAGEALDLGSDKLYFKIGEVAEIVGVPAYVLRYWESEFKTIRPQKSRSAQRVYRRRDVENLLRIKQLLYGRKFTIAGARQQLREAPEDCPPDPPSRAYLARQSLERVRQAVRELRGLIEDDLDPSVASDPAAYLASKGGVSGLLGGEGAGGDATRHRAHPRGLPAGGLEQPMLLRPDRA